ncbi:MAG: hypothetical protein JOY71_07885 [Acetobacteraceae bacterium]|nr:hypothetical protein [Acetobacteraceae bacterium]
MIIIPRLAALVAPILPLAASQTLAASALTVLAGLCSALLVAEARARTLEAERLFDAGAMSFRHPASELGSLELAGRLGSQSLEGEVKRETRAEALKQAALPAGYLQLAAVLVLSITAAGAAWSSLRTRLTAGDLASPVALSIGLGALLLCFPLMLVERQLNATSKDELPEAASLAALIRLGLAALLGFGIAKMLVSLGYSWGIWAVRAVALVCFLVALELALRTVAQCFLPQPPPDEVVGVATSSIAGLLRFSHPANVRDAVRRTLGIDVTQSWALGFIRQAMLPAVVALGIGAWLLTGLTALPLNSRAVYEQLGRPVRVLGPGLHLCLPWPLGRLLPVELGAMHDLPVGGGGAVAAETEPDSDAETAIIAGSSQTAASGSGADRLWDLPHPQEATYLIASNTGDQPGFQVIDIDMRIVWLVGESDRDALAAVYSVEQPERLIDHLASRLLARRFAGSTLSAVLVEDRAAFIQIFRDELQFELDKLRTGIRLAAVAIEAIHPPPGAAGAYHAVLASDIQARTSIAESRASAGQQQAQARQTAQSTQDEASVSAAEIVAEARAQNRAFAADFTAWGRDRESFLLERRLERIAKVLPAAQTLIVDHRLSPASLPLVDLRSMPAVSLPP